MRKSKKYFSQIFSPNLVLRYLVVSYKSRQEDFLINLFLLVFLVSYVYYCSMFTMKFLTIFLFSIFILLHFFLIFDVTQNLDLHCPQRNADTVAKLRKNLNSSKTDSLYISSRTESQTLLLLPQPTLSFIPQFYQLSVQHLILATHMVHELTRPSVHRHTISSQLVLR